MIKACVIGLGQRGHMLTRDVLLKIDKLEIVSVCDVYEDRIERTLETLKNANQTALGFTDYKEALAVEGVQAAFIFTDWSTHTEMAVYAMEHGIAVGSEVGCEYSLENCYKLVKTWEKTRTPYMFMENCCWGKDE